MLTLRRLATLTASAVALLACTSTAASAAYADPEPQLTALNAGFLQVAPAPAHQATLCDIDTGVNVNPGTAHALVVREAVDGGSPHDNDAVDGGHGTMMVALMSNPISSHWGMPGLWPWLRVISERATNESGILQDNLAQAAIDRCRVLGANVINFEMSFAATNDLSAWEAPVQRALAAGIVLYSAAGNTFGGGVTYPALVPGVTAVGASDGAGAFCPISAQGPQIALTAAGCDIYGTLPDGAVSEFTGTSDATAYASAATTALMAYSGLSAAAAENLILRTATPDPAGPRLNVAAAFSAAGLGAMTRLRSPVPTTVLTPAQIASEHVNITAVRLARFRVRVTITGALPGVTVLIRAGRRVFAVAHTRLTLSGASARVRRLYGAISALGYQQSHWVALPIWPAPPK